MSSNELKKQFYRRIRQQDVPTREREAIEAKIATHKYKTRNVTETGLGNRTKGEDKDNVR